MIAIATYIRNSKYSSYNDMEAKKLLLLFVILNIVELVFWGFGLYTLKGENGDVRDSMMNHRFSAEDDNPYGGEDDGGIGTLK